MNLAENLLWFREIDRTLTSLVGGKGAHLGELARLEGIRVPEGFCITTDSFARVIRSEPSLNSLIDRLCQLDPGDRQAIRSISAEVRRTISDIPIPDDLRTMVAGAMAMFGEQETFAIRSSATAEDLPTASFAGQQDTFLNVVGLEAILAHIRLCWASLFSERAVTYRLQNGFDHRKVRMAVVVQEMVFPEAAGILFTADPVSGNRKVASIDAGFGLGESLVSGLINPDVYKVREDEVVGRAIGEKRIALLRAAEGGTRQVTIEPEQRREPALTDEQAVRLTRLGRRIEAHFGRPQDIEWCLLDDDFHIVQSRPITTLFPIPDTEEAGTRVYASVGHQQMMTDAMKPLGISFWQVTAARPMYHAGGRLFVDITPALATPEGRRGLIEGLGKADPLTRDALETVLARPDLTPELAVPDSPPAAAPAGGAPPTRNDADPAIVAELIASSRESVAALAGEIREKSGAELLDYILADIGRMKQQLFDPRNHQAIMAGFEATWWLNEQLHDWLGERNAADILAQSAPGNVTSEMGLALLAVADAVRPHPQVVSFLEGVADDDFLDELPALEGGTEARSAIQSWLDSYGVRCPGEIDITRPRWSEHPTMLVPMLLGNVRNFEQGAGERRFEKGLEEARKKEEELLRHLRALPDGERKADETRQMIRRLRAFIGYREYPKYSLVSRYFVYRTALLREADRLVQSGILRGREDIFFLTFEELREVVRTNEVDAGVIRERKEAFEVHRALTPPRVLTSDGEAIAGSYHRDDLPESALVGLAVSAGVAEGRARVVLDMGDAGIEPGDILVTRFTDPSWTPLFVGISGLVTEIGGLMTHGAVIAREYGLPAVVGVEGATHLIRDGQRIRVHGTEGYVEILEEVD